MRDIFNTKILFFFIVFGCCYLIFNQFSIEAYSFEPPEMLSKNKSSFEMVMDWCFKTTNLISEIVLKHSTKALKGIIEFICGSIESLFGKSSFCKEMIDICGQKNENNGQEDLSCYVYLWHNLFFPMLYGFLIYSFVHIYLIFMDAKYKCRKKCDC